MSLNVTKSAKLTARKMNNFVEQNISEASKISHNFKKMLYGRKGMKNSVKLGVQLERNAMKQNGKIAIDLRKQY